MTLADVLQITPIDAAHEADRAALIDSLRSLMSGLAAQQTADGRWLTVVDFPAGPVAGNFLDTSCSAMLVYAISKAVAAGYLDVAFTSVASKAYKESAPTRASTRDGHRGHSVPDRVGRYRRGSGRPSNPGTLHDDDAQREQCDRDAVNPLTNDLHGWAHSCSCTSRSSRTRRPFRPSDGEVVADGGLH